MDQTKLIMLAELLAEYREWAICYRYSTDVLHAVGVTSECVIADILPSLRPR